MADTSDVGLGSGTDVGVAEKTGRFRSNAPRPSNGVPRIRAASQCALGIPLHACAWTGKRNLLSGAPLRMPAIASILCQNSALAGVPIGAGRDPVPSEFVETYQNVVALLWRVSLEHLITFGASTVNIIAKPETKEKHEAQLRS
jgi:hypothetical protein